MALNFDWSLFQRAEEEKNRNRDRMNQNIAGLGQGLGGGMQAIGQMIQQKKQKALMDQLVQAMRTQGAPTQGPQMAPIQGPSGYMPPGISSGTPAGQTPTSLGPLQDNTQAINALMMQISPEIYMKDIYPKTMKRTMGGTGKRVVYQAPDGSVSLKPVEGSTPLEVSDAQAMQYTAVPKSAKEKNKATEARADAWQRSIDVKQIDELARTMGITPHQRNVLQQNNMRADRALQLASKPMTWQEFSMVLTDAAAIMQGGVPHIDQLNNAAYPTWQQSFSKWKTIATSKPTENVPPEIQNRVMSMINGVKEVDNRYLQMNSKFQQKMLGRTIRGGLGDMAPTIDKMTSDITQGGASDKPSGGGWSYVGADQ